MEPTFPLTISEPGRADALLSSALDGVTRSAAQKWLEEGRVTLNGQPLKKNTRLSPGDVLLITPPQPEAVDLIPQDIPLDIVYEDNDVIVRYETLKAHIRQRREERALKYHFFRPFRSDLPLTQHLKLMQETLETRIRRK